MPRVADPRKLARWIVRFRFDDQDFFEVDPVRYADALGELGLAAYRREVRQRQQAGDDSFAAKYAEERLAVRWPSATKTSTPSSGFLVKT